MTDLINKAKEFAITAHDSIGQVRKYTGQPYWVHPEKVASLVTSTGGTPEQIAAAWLHDVVEDTPVEHSDIEYLFGKEVAELVFWLTDISRPEDGNRATRKALDREHISKAPKEAKAVKLADLIDNTDSIVKHDKKFAKVYIKEKEALLTVLKDSENDILYQTAKDMLAWAKKELKNKA